MEIDLYIPILLSFISSFIGGLGGYYLGILINSPIIFTIYSSSMCAFGAGMITLFNYFKVSYYKK